MALTFAADSWVLIWELRCLPIAVGIQYQLVHQVFVGEVPEYTTNLLTPASDIARHTHDLAKSFQTGQE